ncbi:MAG: hypothetical protein C0507_06675 [Cyanobacteria bacterium PR.3.49]|nr:hypothetical protein [Cyanobacteria bacterium PR.3.49]
MAFCTLTKYAGVDNSKVSRKRDAWMQILNTYTFIPSCIPAGADKHCMTAVPSQLVVCGFNLAF